MFWKWNRTNSTKLLKIKTQDKKAAQHNPHSWKKWLSKLYFNLKIICLSETRKETIPWGQPSHGQELTRKCKGNQSWSGRRGWLWCIRSLQRIEGYNVSHCKLSRRSWPEGKNSMTQNFTPELGTKHWTRLGNIALPLFWSFWAIPPCPPSSSASATTPLSCASGLIPSYLLFLFWSVTRNRT